MFDALKLKVFDEFMEVYFKHFCKFIFKFIPRSLVFVVTSVHSATQSYSHTHTVASAVVF